MKKFLEWCRKHIRLLVGLGVIFFVVGLSNTISNTVDSVSDEIETVDYAQFMKDVRSGNIDTLYYSGSKEWMSYTLLNDDTRNMTREERDEYIYDSKDKRKTLYPAYENFRKDMLAAGVNMVLIDKTDLISLFSSIFSLAIMCFWVYLLLNMFRGPLKGLDKDKITQKSDVKFDNIIGLDEIVDDIKFIVKLIKNPKIGEDIGAKTPKGVLLVGPPGTGKTLIAKAIAGEAEVPFFSMSGSDFKELYVGMGAKRVRELFAEARKNKPCVVFIDEIDSVGASRTKLASNSEDNQTINALLKEMDGFTSREGIFLIAATNNVDSLDSALIRSGRFDRQIHVNPPRDYRVRTELFKYYLKNLKVADDIDIEAVSKQVVGFTGADIEAVCNEASIVAMMHDKTCIDKDCIEEALDKKIFSGNRSKEDHFIKDKETIAYHEAGHAVMHWLRDLGISRASILGTTSGVGGAVFGEDKDSCLMTKTEIISHVLACYAGRASESIKFGEISTGASNDITQATNYLNNYITKYGFDDEVGLIDLDVINDKRFVDTSALVSKLSELSNELYKQCYELLNENYKYVEALAQKLLDVETLSGNEISELFESVKKEEEECDVSD